MRNDGSDDGKSLGRLRSLVYLSKGSLILKARGKQNSFEKRGVAACTSDFIVQCYKETTAALLVSGHWPVMKGGRAGDYSPSASTDH